MRANTSESEWAEYPAFVKGIKAALDTTSGECISADQTIVDPSLPLDKQLRAAKMADDYPDWATPDDGMLLADRDLGAEGKTIGFR